MLDFLIRNWVIILSAGLAVLWILGSIFLYRRLFKRIYDILFSLIGMPFFFLLFVPIAIAVKASDKGPVFYCGERAGKNGKIFKMKKFRSMKVNAPDIRLEDGSTYSAKDDPRVTKIGRFLRKTSLDEIPQIIDIFLGNMSFIGPRPDVPDVVEKLEGDDRLLLKTRPGITGYSQAKFRNAVEYKEKIEHDCAYVKKISIWLDIKIIFLTVWVVLRRKNLYNNATGTIDETTLGGEVLEVLNDETIAEPEDNLAQIDVENGSKEKVEKMNNIENDDMPICTYEELSEAKINLTEDDDAADSPVNTESEVIENESC